MNDVCNEVGIYGIVHASMSANHFWKCQYFPSLVRFLPTLVFV